MRIVAGAYRGRRLATPRGRDVRPTSDKVREATFSMLGDVNGLAVLDLFAGTGAMGLEALSRGARSATFVELDRSALDVVQRNIAATITDDRSATRVVKGDARRVVQSLAMAGDRFDLVVFDPPYEETREMLEATSDTLPAVFSPQTVVVLELSTRHASLVDDAAAAWGAEADRTRTYGDTTVALLRSSGQHDTSVPFDPRDPDAMTGPDDTPEGEG